MDATSLAVGVDVGGTHVTAALVLPVEKRLRRETLQRAALDSRADAATILDALGGVIGRVLRAVPTGGAPIPLGLSFPGPFDYAAGVAQLRPPEKYGALFGLKLAPLLTDRLAGAGCGAMRFVNDAACFAWGECAAYGGPGKKSLLALTLGTGFGSAFIVDGALCAAGPRVPPDGHLYHQLFRSGRADDYFSTRWLVQRYRELTGVSLTDAKQLHDLAQPENAALPRQVFAEMAENLAEFLTPWLRSAAIGRIVFGGNISRAWPLFEPTLARRLAADGLAVELARAEDAEEAAVLGAALFAAARPGPAPRRKSNYDLQPVLPVPDGAGACVAGWEEIAARLSEGIARRGARRTVLVVECYPGVQETEILVELEQRLRPTLTLRAAAALRPPPEIEALVAPFLGGTDPVFGRLSDLELPQFFDPGLVAKLRVRLEQIREGLVLVVGCGARLLGDGDVLVYADLARWEAQLRFRRNETSNLGAANHTAPVAAQYKRAFFVDWRVADRWKQPLIARWDFILDTHRPGEPRLAEGEALRRGLRHATTRPFRVVPFFDPAPWGGQWMKEVCGLDPSAPNYGWCFDCVPEENSLLLGFGPLRVEIPAMDLVLFEPRALLGAQVHARFGAEFPIRFDLLDTMGGGHLSLQVHPLAAYAREHFGLSYTQDESYYLLDAAPGAEVYLGLCDGADATALAEGLRQAQTSGRVFPTERHVARWPAKKHDHFLIPAGTIHCSGADCLVLEISATPYIFTFKLWDWARAGLDGRPRPIHLEHGLANLQWNRTATWVRSNLINTVTPAGEGESWRAERTGLHDSQFIESVRHWFTGPVPHHTRDGVHVLNLIEGEEAVVESPAGAFAPFTVHFAETFIVPAAVGAYTIRPAGPSGSQHCATIRASVRESGSAASGRPSSYHVHHPDS